MEKCRNSPKAFRRAAIQLDKNEFWSNLELGTNEKLLNCLCRSLNDFNAINLVSSSILLEDSEEILTSLEMEIEALQKRSI